METVNEYLTRKKSPVIIDESREMLFWKDRAIIAEKKLQKIKEVMGSVVGATVLTYSINPAKEGGNGGKDSW